MKTDILFNDIKNNPNVYLIENVDKEIQDKFLSLYDKYKDYLFFEVIENIGGLIINNWIRLYGCGELNILKKNELFLDNKIIDILIGEDVIGGLWGLKDNIVYYFAPETLEWCCLDITYSNFINWLTNYEEKVNLFYKNFRWDNWKEESSLLQINQGFSFYPLLNIESNINKASIKIINLDEIISMYLNLSKQLKEVKRK